MGESYQDVWYTDTRQDRDRGRGRGITDDTVRKSEVIENVDEKSKELFSKYSNVPVQREIVKNILKDGEHKEIRIYEVSVNLNTLSEFKDIPPDIEITSFGRIENINVNKKYKLSY